MRDTIKNNIQQLIQEDGLKRTHIKEIELFKSSTNFQAPLTYELCMVFVLSGRKIGKLPHKDLEFAPNNYLVVPTTIPLMCETFGSVTEPFVGMVVKIDKSMMYEIAEALAQEVKTFKKPYTAMGIFTDTTTPQIDEVLHRILQALSSKVESKLLGSSLLKELYYHVAIGQNAEYLQKMFLNSQVEAKIARSLRKIHEAFSLPLEVSKLAKEAEMSLSSYHTHFKAITTFTPLQYIKKIRLTRAFELLKREHLSVTQCSYNVGYESPAQFSKDFKNLFGYPPSKL
ncbi:MAG: Unknown protein [uncultured Sulfurovum sp.]|uniref:HTH araC/xylS-type domain-containing protein n=1 Tax=uncultured Sulfurovum sp. TaxID=269237 RepID=A0A6S6TIX7_9BACT|nr:MAG: Unknown protein [uncultured Sulfurovum sp.]